MTPRQVLGLNRGVPVPPECAILNVPSENTAVSTLLPGWVTPPAVNTLPVAMMLSGPVGEVVTIWKCSNPEPAAAGLALAAVRPATATAAAAATTLTPARNLFLSFIMVHTSPLTGSYSIRATGWRQASTAIARAGPDRIPTPGHATATTAVLSPPCV